MGIADMQEERARPVNFSIETGLVGLIGGLLFTCLEYHLSNSIGTHHWMANVQFIGNPFLIGLIYEKYVRSRFISPAPQNSQPQNSEY